MSTVTKGRRVHFFKNGKCYVADIVQVWSPPVVNLVVTLDGTNDRIITLENEKGALHVWRTSIEQDESKDETKYSSWHWPERTE